MRHWLKAHARRAALNLLALAVMIYQLVSAAPAAGDFAGNDAALQCGKWAIRFLLACLSMTPLRWAFGWNHAIKLRKPAGLWSFAFAALHFALFLQDRAAPWRLRLRVPFLSMGLAGFLMLTLLAATSNRWAMQALKTGWKRLHRLVYPAAVVVALHALLAASQSKRMALQEPDAARELQVYLALVIVLLVVRLPPVRRLLQATGRRRRAVGAAHADPAIEVREIPARPSPGWAKPPSLPAPTARAYPAGPNGLRVQAGPAERAQAEPAGSSRRAGG